MWITYNYHVHVTPWYIAAHDSSWCVAMPKWCVITTTWSCILGGPKSAQCVTRAYPFSRVANALYLLAWYYTQHTHRTTTMPQSHACTECLILRVDRKNCLKWVTNLYMVIRLTLKSAAISVHVKEREFKCISWSFNISNRGLPELPECVTGAW